MASRKMGIALTVPPSVVSLLRSALIAEVGEAAAEISSVSALAGRERHPERFEPHLHRFDAGRGLLDTIGWTEPRPREPVEIELDPHRAVLVDALLAQLDWELYRRDADLALGADSRQRRHAQRNARQIQVLLAKVGAAMDQGE